ncbi:hypothetical protein A8C32_19360 [Flavivirga aquatica]|uniref:Uncharacterized protein n=1 Tax=Flavivirga aquatica TaxID=1849968 RepID=A0A1E5T3S9_9FLAO|nr:hypothetical protein [Flavivirga aquatica]OEK05991.1 hypothetical protein A8C32_19360 [Flavivirga aquatica]
MEFIKLVLGGMSISEWLFHVVLMWLGILLYVLLRIQKRKDKITKLTFKYWRIQTNNIIILILTYILIRFYANYKAVLVSSLPEGIKMTPYFMMVVIGFGQHKISKWLSKKIIKKTI